MNTEEGDQLKNNANGRLGGKENVGQRRERNGKFENPEEKGRGGKRREYKEAIDEMKKLKKGVGQVLFLIIPFQVKMSYWNTGVQEVREGKDQYWGKK